MMPLLWVLLWSSLPDPALLSGPGGCGVRESSSSQSASPLLESLQCHNDYEFQVRCTWRKQGSTPLELWFNTSTGRELCVARDVAGAAESGAVHCTYNTRLFFIGVKHTAFFLPNKTLSICSSGPHQPLDLLQHVAARPPVNLSTHDAGDGGRRLRWSSPYPSSSSLHKDLTYQLSYRTHRQDGWATESTTNTSMTLARHVLLPGRRYEARVRARAGVGQWSDWSPVVTWRSTEDLRQFPALHCVLDGEREVTCSWEVSRELAHFITYQLACRRQQTARSERCCEDPAVSSDLSGAVLRYSCSLTVADPEHLLLDLQPAHAAKTFQANQHIRPNRPQQVKVRRKNSNWLVEWTEPRKAAQLRLVYQVCYYRTQDQGSPVLLNLSEGPMFKIIPGASLAPSQDYQVKVRALVAPGDSSSYEGTPSEWSETVSWRSDDATWSFTTLIYIFIGVFAAAVFLTLYGTIPACKRRAVLWVDSVPSPGKSKILSELQVRPEASTVRPTPFLFRLFLPVQSASDRTLLQNERTSICKVQHLDSVSTCSSDALLWPAKDAVRKCPAQGEGCWGCDDLRPPSETLDSADTPSMSYTGPYILCQSSEPAAKSVDVKTEEEDAPSEASASPSAENFTLYGEGYVCLPRPSASMSTQDLQSHSDDSTSMRWQDSAEQDQQCPDLHSDTQPGLSEPTSGDRPPEYTSGPFTSWPQGGTIQASGYCHLPTAQ